MAKKKQELNLDRETRRIYWRFSQRYRATFLAAFISRPLFLFSSYIGNIVLVSVALDRLVRPGLDFGRDLAPLIFASVGLEIMRLITEQLSLTYIWKAQAKTQNDLAAHCYEDLTMRDAAFHANHFTGSLVAQVNRFVNAYERLTDSFFWNIYALVFGLLSTFIILFIKLPSFAFVLLFIICVYGLVSFRSNKASARLNAVRAAEESANTGQLADSITNSLAVKSYGRERHEIKRYKLGLERIERANDVLRFFTIKKDTRLSIFVSSVSSLAFVMSLLAYYKGYASIGTIALATGLTRDTLMRLREFNNITLRNISRSFGDARDMTRTLLTETTVTDPRVPVPFEIKNGGVEFKDVKFWYPEKSATDALFEHLQLSIAPGEKVGLVGPSGGGKTTITKLLLRFMDIQDGSIEIDGQDIAKSKQTDVRRAISYVPQEPLLFHRSLSENIAYGEPRASQARIVAAAKKAHAHEFIQKLPNGYDTLVGERGVKLSGGQRQRIAIARAMLKNAPILVLDEATSALDSEAEALIQDALWNLMKGKTAVVIAHRLSTIQRMDRIVVLDEGNIVEEGSHKELLSKQNGLYAKLWQHQSGGFLQD
jgi:ATP-binding cassette subfamily B protein